jgi:hypothetical protein
MILCKNSWEGSLEFAGRTIWLSIDDDAGNPTAKTIAAIQAALPSLAELANESFAFGQGEYADWDLACLELSGITSAASADFSLMFSRDEPDPTLFVDIITMHPTAAVLCH